MRREQRTTVQMIAEYDGDLSTIYKETHTGDMAILATRNMVLFPGVIAPIMVGRKQSRSLLAKLKRMKEGTPFAVFCQRDPETETLTQRDLMPYGVVARLMRVIEMPGVEHVLTCIVQGLGRCRLAELYDKNTPYLTGRVEDAPEEMPGADDEVFDTACQDLRRVIVDYITHNEDIPDETQLALNGITNGPLLVNFIATNMPFDLKDKAAMLASGSMNDRIIGLLRVLNKEQQFLAVKNLIHSRTREDIDEQQREYYLRQQLSNIKEELGEGDTSPEIKELREKMAKRKATKEVMAVFDKEMDKLALYNNQSPEYAMQITYLQTIAALPWGVSSKDNLDVRNARRVLDRDHYGMEKVKERILEYIAVLRLRGDLKSPILCLYGPPGVGKTSLGKSIARALKRKYVRASLGGLHDEAEIRGHRRTYVGAMPGQIIKSLQKAGTNNPVFILDEIDKVTQNTFQGDPASALLEVLDPEQNGAFHDNYLDIDFDLSRVLFIATANDVGAIPGPLRDRMELIEVSGYITEEKQEIAARHLVPKEAEANGFVPKKTSFAKAAVEQIVENYTRESGVRQLEKQIAKTLRKVAYERATAEEPDDTPVKIKAEDIEKYLGKPPFFRDIYQGNDYAGVVTGLAWTAVGGEILYIETSLSRGKGDKLTLTGNLGNVMKESAVIALQYVKAHADELGVDHRVFDAWNLHIHVPEGATPKDGPSAGITIATSIASALTQRKVRANTAMTGEITLRGKVLPVGGIKEKILAAKRAGITDIMLCQDNRKDIEEIPEMYLRGVSFHYVENVQDVWRFALTDERVKDAVELTVEEEVKS